MGGEDAHHALLGVIGGGELVDVLGEELLEGGDGLGERWRLFAEERLELAKVGDGAEEHPQWAEELIASLVGHGRRHQRLHDAEVVEEAV